MRCGCPQCGTYMIQSEGIDFGCVCPECLYRCRACMGTNTVVSREDLRNLTFVDHTAEHEAQEERATAGANRSDPRISSTERVKKLSICCRRYFT